MSQKFTKNCYFFRACMRCDFCAFGVLQIVRKCLTQIFLPMLINTRSKYNPGTELGAECSGCRRVFPGASRCCRVLPVANFLKHFYRCYQMLPDADRCSSVPGAPGCQKNLTDKSMLLYVKHFKWWATQSRVYCFKNTCKNQTLKAKQRK